ncbi:MAG: LPS assembly protein LptD [Gammaproteobacteria bacterium]|nr:LPS assembly protein LptD [Gammaproteobacteria bacterium]NNC57270.1 LPS assembly protein LptD [Woeseiaceae bacterium]
MSAKPLILACCLLAVIDAHGSDPLACSTSIGGPLTRDPEFLRVPLPNPRTIELEAGQFEAQIGKEPTASMTGGVLLRQDDKLAGADTARYDPQQQAIHLEGRVRYEDPGTQIHSDSAEFSYLSGRIRFEGAAFSLGSNNARGAAAALEINQEGELILDGVEYTTCPPGSEDWLLQGESIKLDTGAGVGTAKGIKLQFKGLPILYAPYLSFPLSDARKSGLLTPEIGSAGRSGNEIRLPYYWNIAPNYDATITPRLLTNRGIQLETEFRYLTPRNDGIVTADYLSNDSILDASRHQLRYRHRTLFENGWRNKIEFREVSDSQYFEDLGGSLSISSITHLNRSVRFDYYTENLSLLGQIQDYQTIDNAIVAADEPYRRVPQVFASGSWPVSILRLGVLGEVVNFDRDVGVTGWRVNAAPSLELPIARAGWFVTPAVSLDHTRYQLSNASPGAETDPTRTVPIASLDTGMVLERSLNGANRIQTIEPRLLYVNIPYRDQDGLPVFDTITPDINLVQLYRKNRFLGVDRIGDTEQVSIGVTSRVLDVSSGRELMTATIGQTRYFGDREVVLPGATASTFETSDYIAQLRFLIWENMNFDFGHQWGTGASGTTKSEARLQYRPTNKKVLNLAYRFRRDSLEQGDLSWSWPVSTQWNFVGRYNFSFRDQEVLEQFFGLEYESCCWGLRLVSRRHISTRDGTRDSSFGLQLVLKGMTSVGTAADKLLERGILGYSADLR